MMNKKRRDEIKNIVLLTLKRISDNDLPIKIKKIVKSMKNCRLIPYSVHMKNHNYTYKQMVDFAETKDACTDYYASDDKYIIYYNDIEPNIINSNRHRWNIAHELGHIVLNHHKVNNKTRIFRSRLSDSEYTILEDEADYFASYILVPYSVLYSLSIFDQYSLGNACAISNSATKYRFLEYIKWFKNSKFKDKYDFKLLEVFIKNKICGKCKKMVHLNNMYCPICGSDIFYINRGECGMIYKGIEVDENGRALKCPICENEEIQRHHEHCKICGTYIVNKCADINNCNCGISLDGNARYCHKCGSESSFHISCLLTSWDFKEDEDLPF